MANCDWGRPCDCRECRTKQYAIKCPQCGINNHLEVLRHSEYKTDRNGVGYYDFTIPQREKSDLICHNCSENIVAAGVYDNNLTEANVLERKRIIAIKEGRMCSSCGKVDEVDRISSYKSVTLTDKMGKKLCQDCLVSVLKKEQLDPSDSDNKYEFDTRSLSWKHVKVRKACIICGKKRWLNVENAWKDKCINCYKTNR